MKPHHLIALFVGLMLSGPLVCANSLNEVVKEARQHGQVLSAKTRQGVHEVRVVTPQGSVKTIRKPATIQKQSPQTPHPRSFYNQNRPDTYGQDNKATLYRRPHPNSRQPEFRRFQRPAQSSAATGNSRPTQRPVQRPAPQPRRQARPRPSDDRDPD
ncbi:MAG: hypothetical protein ACK5L8_05580 [Marinicella pacifica]